MTQRGRKPQLNTKKNLIKELTCGMCGETRKVGEYYQSYNPIHTTSKLPYCKKCLKNMCIDSNGNINIDKVKQMLKLIDRPFVYDMFKSSMDDKNDTIGTYMKNLALNNKMDGWNSSIFEPVCENENIKSDRSEDKENINIKKLQEKYGYGFEVEEYLNFERKYAKLSRGYKEKTELHSERLITYITHKVKEEMATAKGQVGEAEKWARLAQADATAAKLNVSQLSKSDITGGIDLVPQLVEAVESHTSLIPLMPKLKEQPYDDADLIIWAIINKVRRLEEKPKVEYVDIWNFYDKMIEEHYTQKGHTKEQIDQEKQKRNNMFRDLGSLYVEPLYNQDENEFTVDEEEGDY